ncbi:MAG: hypothetical protein HC880_10750 [Bacteroidia bacterium]|nr:hypothetical protein [Bacteroidia bacterium]
MLLAGNLYTAEVETVRNDASVGLLLLGDGRGNWTPLAAQQIGFVAPADVKKMVWVVGDRENQIWVGNNDGAVQIFEWIGKE